MEENCYDASVLCRLICFLILSQSSKHYQVKLYLIFNKFCDLSVLQTSAKFLLPDFVTCCYLVFFIVVHLEDKMHEKTSKDHNSKNDLNGQIFSTVETLTSGSEDYKGQKNQGYFESDNLRLRKKTLDQTMVMHIRKEGKDANQDYSGSDSENRFENFASSTQKSVKNSTDTVSRADDLPYASQIVEVSEESIIPTEVSYMSAE